MLTVVMSIHPSIYLQNQSFAMHVIIGELDNEPFKAVLVLLQKTRVWVNMLVVACLMLCLSPKWCIFILMLHRHVSSRLVPFNLWCPKTMDKSSSILLIPCAINSSSS